MSILAAPMNSIAQLRRDRAFKMCLSEYHTDKEIDKIRFMFQDYALLPHQISLSAEKEMIRRMQRQAEIVEALGLMDETPKQ